MPSNTKKARCERRCSSRRAVRAATVGRLDHATVLRASSGDKVLPVPSAKSRRSHGIIIFVVRRRMAVRSSSSASP